VSWFKFAIAFGMDPRIEFPLKFNACSEGNIGSAPRGPVRPFPDKSRFVNALSCESFVGIVPVNEFCPRFKETRGPKDANALGMFPVKLLSPRSNDVSNESCPMEEGMLFVRLFPSRFKAVRSVKRPICEGRLPRSFSPASLTC